MSGLFALRTFHPMEGHFAHRRFAPRTSCPTGHGTRLFAPATIRPKDDRPTDAVNINNVGGQRHAMHPHLSSSPRGLRSASRGWADGNGAEVSRSQHVHKPTAVAAWRANTAVSKAAWRPWLLTLKVVSESRVTWATSVPILVFLVLVCSRYARCTRQSDVRQYVTCIMCVCVRVCRPSHAAVVFKRLNLS